MKIVYLDEVESTNTYLKTAAREFPEGGVVVAGAQTLGRGRLGRTFCSVSGGLYMSVLLHPKIPLCELAPLTVCTAVLVCDAIEELCLFRPQIKWPNDLMSDGKKLCGILTELEISGGECDYVITGIGINLNTKLSDYPEDLQPVVTSVFERTGSITCRDSLVKLIADKIMRCCSGENLPLYSEALISRAKTDCITIGTELYASDKTCGKAVDISLSGGLIILRSDGNLEEKTSGEVTEYI